LGNILYLKIKNPGGGFALQAVMALSTRGEAKNDSGISCSVYVRYRAITRYFGATVFGD
jgi:hypothetical protein